MQSILRLTLILTVFLVSSFFNAESFAPILPSMGLAAAAVVAVDDIGVILLVVDGVRQETRFFFRGGTVTQLVIPLPVWVVAAEAIQEPVGYELMEVDLEPESIGGGKMRRWSQFSSFPLAGSSVTSTTSPVGASLSLVVFLFPPL